MVLEPKLMQTLLVKRSKEATFFADKKYRFTPNTAIIAINQLKMPFLPVRC